MILSHRIHVHKPVFYAKALSTPSWPICSLCISPTFCLSSIFLSFSVFCHISVGRLDLSHYCLSHKHTCYHVGKLFEAFCVLPSAVWSRHHLVHVLPVSPNSRTKGERRTEREKKQGASFTQVAEQASVFFFFSFLIPKSVFFIHPTTKKIVFLPQEVVSIVHVTRFSSTSCLAANRP